MCFLASQFCSWIAKTQEEQENVPPGGRGRKTKQLITSKETYFLPPLCPQWVLYAFVSIAAAAAAAAKSLQSYPTLYDPIDSSPPGSNVPGILQARTLEWVAISFSNVWKWKLKVKSLSHVRLFATPWTAAYQAPPPMGFPRKWVLYAFVSIAALQIGSSVPSFWILYICVKKQH